jgi:hypothetical protein
MQHCECVYRKTQDHRVILLTGLRSVVGGGAARALGSSGNGCAPSAYRPPNRRLKKPPRLWGPPAEGIRGCTEGGSLTSYSLQTREGKFRCLSYIDARAERLKGESHGFDSSRR